MMSSAPKKPAPTGLKVPRRSKSRGVNQYLAFLAVGAVVVIVIVVVLASAKKPAAAPAKTKAKSTDVAQPKPDRDRDVRPAKADRISARDRRAARDRDRDRDDRDRSSGRTSRSSGSGSYSGRRSSRNDGVPVLSTIMQSPSGGRVAVFGVRSVRGGEQIDGRQVLEVDADKVRVSYRNETYEVKVGQPLYNQ